MVLCTYKVKKKKKHAKLNVGGTWGNRNPQDTSGGTEMGTVSLEVICLYLINFSICKPIT